MNHFGGRIGGPIVHDKLFFFFDSEWVRIALPIVTAATVPTPAFQNTSAAASVGRNGLGTGSLTSRAATGAFLQKMFSLYKDTSGTPLADTRLSARRGCGEQ